MVELIVQKNPKSPISEAYRTLRTNIQFSSLDKNIQTILITSSGPSEGKSTTAANLAAAIAQSGKRILIIDCDLRKPTIHRKFKISNQTGLTNILVENMNINEAVQEYSDNLYVLTAGTIPPNPAELVASKKMRGFLEKAKAEFEYILLDTPPVIAVTDAQILSTLADGVLLVVSSGEAEREAVAKSKNLLDNVKANILGVVLNKLNINSRSDYKYTYYYGDSKGRRKRR